MSIRTSIAWTFSEQFLQYGMQFAASVIIARLLTPDEIGIFVLAMSASAILTSLRAFGVGSYLIREPDLDLAKIRSAFGIMLAVSWSLGLILFLSRDFVAGLYERESIAEAMSLLSLNFVISPLGAPAAAHLTREMRFKVLHNIGIASSAIGTLVSVVLAYLGLSYMALTWGLLTTTSLYALFSMLAMPQYAFVRPSFAHWRKIAEFGGLLSLATLIGKVNTEGTKFILGGFLNPAAVAQFDRAAQLPNNLRRGIFGPIGRVLLPAWSEHVRQGRSIGPAVEKLISLNTVIVWPVFLSLSFMATPFMTLVFGENWRPAGEIFPWILLAQGILSMLPQPEQILLPYGKVKRIFAVRCAGALFAVSVGAYGASLGLEAFAICRVAATSFLTVLVFFSIKPFIALQAWRLIAVYLRSGLVAVIASIPAAIFYFTEQETMTLQGLVLVVAACGLFWLGGIAITRHFVWIEGLRMAGSAMGRG